MIWGKIVGGLIGLSMGPLGFIAGLLIGHWFDRGLAQSMGFMVQNQAEIQQLFFETSFSLMGHIAKADGRVSEEEIAVTEQLMERMALSAERKREAIALFKKGSAADFSAQQQLLKFVTAARHQRLLCRSLLEHVIGMAMADGELHEAEKAVLREVGTQLGVPRAQFEAMLEMLTAQQGFAGGRAKSSVDDLEMAYKALGVNASASKADIKRAYRKLMSEHHPDKLASKGLPPEAVKAATEKAQEITAAYELIKDKRG